jgi:hypothetical protein
MNETAKTVLIFLAVILFAGYQFFINRTDPDLKQGVRCLIEQLAEHRIGTRGADDASAQHHGYKYAPEERAGYDNPPEPSGDPRICAPFLESTP